MKTKKKLVMGKWMREHSASMRPTVDHKYQDSAGKVYMVLSNGMRVHELTARKLGY